MCSGIRYLILGSECRVRQRLCQYFFYHFIRKITLCCLLIFKHSSLLQQSGKKIQEKAVLLVSTSSFSSISMENDLFPFILLIWNVCISFLEENLPHFGNCLTPESFEINLFLGRMISFSSFMVFKLLLKS